VTFNGLEQREFAFTAQRNGGNQQRNSYGAYGNLTEFVSTATAKRQPQNGNGTLETRHQSPSESFEKIETITQHIGPMRVFSALMTKHVR